MSRTIQKASKSDHSPDGLSSMGVFMSVFAGFSILLLIVLVVLFYKAGDYAPPGAPAEAVVGGVQMSVVGLDGVKI
jgi:hypothetical protein